MKRLLVYRNLIRFTVGDGCWLWQGALYDGYGHAWRGARETLAHRAVYEELIGPVPSGLTLDHLCRVRNCVNPGHLEPVTAAENILRGIGWGALNARKTHCNYGHEFSGTNLIHRPHGGRDCRACRQRNRASPARREYQRQYNRSHPKLRS